MNIIKGSNRKATIKKPIAHTRPRIKTTYKPLTETPKSQEWSKMALLTEHWQSDLKFFQDEIRFLNNLIRKYFLWLIKDENIEKTKGIATELSTLETKRQKLEQSLFQHQQHYHDLLDNPFSHESQKFMEEHGKLESEIASFVSSIKNLKRYTFEVTEQILESEKLKHLVDKA